MLYIWGHLDQKTTCITDRGSLHCLNQSYFLAEITNAYHKFVFYNSDYLIWGGVYVDGGCELHLITK